MTTLIWRAARVPEKRSLGNSMKKIALWGVLTLCFALSPLWAGRVATSPLSGAKAYPNPWRVDRHAGMFVTFAGIPVGTHVKIFTIAAHLVKDITADSSGQALWDRTNSSGEAVASGIYIYLLIDPQGNHASGKLAIIK